MDLQKSLCVFLVMLAGIICSSEAYRFNVGGRDGWVVNPPENYNQWSGRLRFLTNDTLHFIYAPSNSVLVVSRDDYDNCNTGNPIASLTGGDSEFKLNRSGPFYFITGNRTNCVNGQKLIVVVLTMRGVPPPPAPIAPTPTAQTPGTVETPTSSPPSPMAQTPTSSPPSPMAQTPSTAPDMSPTMSPESSPSPSTGSDVPSIAPGLSPSSPSIPAGSPGAGGPTAGGTPSDVSAPPPNGSSAPARSASVVFITFVISVALASFIA